MTKFINKLNYKEEGHLINDEIIVLNNENRIHTLNHHNYIEENGVSIYTNIDNSGDIVNDFSVIRNDEKPFEYFVMFDNEVPNGTYYITYYSQGDENDADDINKIHSEIDLIRNLIENSPTSQIKKGLKSALPVLEEAEMLFCTDTFELYIGSSSGNILINGGVSIIDTRTSDPSSPVNGQIWLRTDV